MSARNNTESETPVESISVSLKPVLGLSPRLYVPILWLFLIGLAVFFLLILPGLRRNGTWLTVDTLPPGCEVIFNGQRLGPSGKPVWAPKGEGILEVRKPGFSSFSEETTVPGRVFASRLFPSKRYMQVILTVNDHFSPQAAGLNSFAGWAGTGPENGRYALPPSLTQAAADLASLEGALEGGASDNAAAPKAAAAEGKKPPLTWAPAALPFSLDQRHLADILRAEIITGGGGAPAGAAQLPELIAAAAVFLDNNPQYASALTLLSGQQPGKTGSSTPEETEADMFSAKAAAEKEAVNRRTEKLIAAFPALWQAKRCPAQWTTRSSPLRIRK
ncbi:MAG: hypothetical protein CSA76_00495 [Spirochaetales bacterium]|nr:MAG: hypothetical protein CSA76_00495 [Spirochaetales bacterium]